MAYLFRQKLRIEELAQLPKLAKRILICEPEEYLSALYVHYLRVQNFDVRHRPDLASAGQTMLNFRPQLLIFSTDAAGTLPSLKSILTKLTVDFPGLGLISTGYNLSSDGLEQLMSVGVCSHINRRLTRPQDLVAVVKNVLQYQ